MNGIFLVVTALAAINPPRTRLGLPETDLRARMGPVSAGSVLAFGALVGLTALSGPLLDALEVTPETFRIAAGFVLLVAGVRSLLRPRPVEEPELEGWGAAVWPVAFPRLFTPEAVAFAIAAGASDGVAGAVIALGTGIVGVILLGMVERRPVADGVLRWTGTLLAVLVVLAATFLMIDGIRDV